MSIISLSCRLHYYQVQMHLKGMILTILGQGLGSTLKMLLDMCPARTFKLSFCNTFLLQVKSYLFVASFASFQSIAPLAWLASAALVLLNRVMPQYR